jgi:hypothetical protein
MKRISPPEQQLRSSQRITAISIVCRQNISDLGLAILESIWLIGFEGSGCDCPLMQAASLFDGLSFDGFPPFEHGRRASKLAPAWP